MKRALLYIVLTLSLLNCDSIVRCKLIVKAEWEDSLSIIKLYIIPEAKLGSCSDTELYSLETLENLSKFYRTIAVEDTDFTGIKDIEEGYYYFVLFGMDKDCNIRWRGCRKVNIKEECTSGSIPIELSSLSPWIPCNGSCLNGNCIRSFDGSIPDSITTDDLSPYDLVDYEPTDLLQEEQNNYCYDPDNDGYGEGSGCLGRDCDESSPRCNIDCSDRNNNGIPDCKENSWIVDTGASFGNYVTESTLGGFIIVGGTDRFGYGNWDIYLAKVTEQGDIIWERAIGSNSRDYAHSAIETKEGNIVIVGEYQPPNSFIENIFILFLDSNGNIIWQKGITSEYGCQLNSVIETKDNNLLVVGEYSNDIFLAKISKDGQIIWQKIISGEGYIDEGNSLIETEDGGVIIVGTSNSFKLPDETVHYEDIYIVKLDPSYNIEWQKVIGGSIRDEGYFIFKTHDGNYLIGGYTQEEGDWRYENMFIAKIKGDGTVLWQKIIGGEEKEYAISGGEMETQIIIFGTENLYESAYILSIDLYGQRIIWQRIIDSPERGYINWGIVTSDKQPLFVGSKGILIGLLNGKGEIWNCPIVSNSSLNIADITLDVRDVNGNISDIAVVINPLSFNSISINTTKRFICGE